MWFNVHVQSKAVVAHACHGHRYPFLCPGQGVRVLRQYVLKQTWLFLSVHSLLLSTRLPWGVETSLSVMFHLNANHTSRRGLADRAALSVGRLTFSTHYHLQLTPHSVCAATPNNPGSVLMSIPKTLSDDSDAGVIDPVYLVTRNTFVAEIYKGAGRSSEVERSLMVRWVVGSILHGVDPLSYFSFQSVLHDWCNKGRGMCYPVCGMMHIKEPLLLIGKSSPCGGSGFPFSLSEWSLTICLTPYNRR